MAISISISITQNSQSIANNTSNVTVAVKASWTYGSYNKLQKSGWLKIDGTKYEFTSSFNTGQSTSGSQTLFTKTVDVAHASNGTKSLVCSASYTSGVSSGTVTASASKTLTTIARVSTLSASNGTLGTAQNLSVSRMSSSLTHTIKYTCGSASGTICTKSSDTSVSFTPPLSLAAQNTTGTSVSIKFTITTYNGDTSVGSGTKTISCSIPASVKPSCTVSVTDATGYSTTYGSFVKGLSKLKVTVTPTTAQGSPIASYKTTANGSTYTAASFTTNVLKSSGNLTVSSTVTDKRGRSGSASASVSVLNYGAPVVSKLNVSRCMSDGTAYDQGEYIKVTYSATVYALNNLNTSTYVLRYKMATAENFTSVVLTAHANKFSVTDGTYIFAADTNSSYNIEFEVKDRHNTTIRKTTASTGFVLLNFNVGGDGIGIGKVNELSKTIELGMDTRVRRPMYVDSPHAIAGVTSDGTTRTAFQPLNENGNTVIGYGNYDAGSGNTHIYGNDVAIYFANQATPGGFRPYFRKGDSLSYAKTFYTAGFVTNGGKDVYFIVPISKPIIGNPTTTIASTDGFMLRQNNAFTHGSTSTTYVKPASYSVIARNLSGVVVMARFSAATNVVNNAPIGICWSGTITFS